MDNTTLDKKEKWFLAEVGWMAKYPLLSTSANNKGFLQAGY